MSDKQGNGPGGSHGTRFFGTPKSFGPGGGADGGRVGGDLDGGERRAQLPAEPPPESLASARVVTAPVAGGATAGLGPVEPTPLPLGMRRSEYEGRPIRESLMLAMRQQRTTFYQVGDLARRLSVLPPGLAEASLVMRQVAVSFALALVVVLLGTMAIAAGTMRLVLGVLAGTVATTLAVFGALRLVSRLGSRRGTSQLPGSALIWVGGVAFVAVATTIALTWGVSEVTRPLLAASTASGSARERVGGGLGGATGRRSRRPCRARRARKRRPRCALRAPRFLRAGRGVRPRHPLPRQHRARGAERRRREGERARPHRQLRRGVGQVLEAAPESVCVRPAPRLDRGDRGGAARAQDSADPPDCAGVLERRARGRRPDPLQPQPARSRGRRPPDGQHARGLRAREQDRGVPHRISSRS